MPLFEYVCRTCDARFETLVRGGERPACPACHGEDLAKQLSVFSVNASDGRSSTPVAGACGTCGDPRGPGACSIG